MLGRPLAHDLARRVKQTGLVPQGNRVNGYVVCCGMAVISLNLSDTASWPSISRWLLA